MGRILEPMPPRRQSWDNTRWSMIGRLDRRQEPAWQASWSYLLERYREPMERYARRVLARAGGARAAEEAGDVVQDFLATCVEKGWLSRADPVRGRFRAYVQTLLRKYVYGYLRYRNAQKRSPGPGREVFTVLESDAVSREPTPDEVAELQEFDRSWVQVALHAALARLAEEQPRYHLVVNDLLLTGGAGSSDLAQRAGVRGPQLPVLKHRARRRLAGLFAAELEATVADEEAYDEELRALEAYIP